MPGYWETEEATQLILRDVQTLRIVALKMKLSRENKKMFVEHFFQLEDETIEQLEELTPEFGYNGFGELVFYRTYSRLKDDGKNENWHDVVIRVINGIMSIRKNHYIQNHIEWLEEFWQNYARRMAISLFKMHWMPPGRGLWAMGTLFIYERGSMSLYNCSYGTLNDSRLGEDLEWLMDSLMVGVGVGFRAMRDNLKVTIPLETFNHQIPDSREGWAHSVRLLIDSYVLNLSKPIFDYSLIRERGLPIRGFGGLASGPEPLMLLHQQIDELMTMYWESRIDIVQLKTDIANLIGVCVVSGNVRRSAEIGLGSIQDEVFLDLKDYEKYPGRVGYGWMSNNTAELVEDEDFELLGEVAKRVTVRGEPGIANLQNFKFGRIGKKNKNIRKDKAKGLNPCGEITLEDRETCNVVETLPTRCESSADWYDACEYATFYASTVALLPTHQPSTNAVVARNRRIGVGIIDYTGWIHELGLAIVTKHLRRGYNIVRKSNSKWNGEAGVPDSIKVTTIKPGGTTPKLAGRTPGMGYPTFHYTLRSIRISDNTSIVPILKNANISYVIDDYDPHTLIFQYPIKQGPAKPATEVSLWEQAFNLITLQREWADNAVSNTLYFQPKWKFARILSFDSPPDLMGFVSIYVKTIGDNKQITQINEDLVYIDDNLKIIRAENTIKLFVLNPKNEESDIEHVLAHIAPLIKSCSLLPHTDDGVYRNMPEAGITKEEYDIRLSKIKSLNWDEFTGSDGLDERYCTGDVCELPEKKI